MYSCASRSAKIHPSIPIDAAASIFFPSLRVNAFSCS